MGPAAIIPLIGTAISVVGGFVGAKKEEDIGDRNAELIARETEEESRRLEKQQKANLATARALSGASGVTMGGSTEGYIKEQASEQQQQLAWLRESGASRSEIARKRGETEGWNTRTSTIAGAFGDVGRVGSAAGWW